MALLRAFLSLGLLCLGAPTVFSANPASAPRLGFSPPAPDDYWVDIWHLENRNWTNGTRLGIDINVRKAWDASKGAGIVVSVVDVGVDLTHPELKLREVPELHYDFGKGVVSGSPLNERAHHGTPVAGLIISPEGDGRGMVGVAPQARFASWLVYETNELGAERFVSPDKMAQMFQHASNTVHIQNHSWAKPGPQLIPMSAQEHAAISNAVHHGRGGRGVVMVHAAGNEREIYGRDANDDAYKSDPRVITVAAARDDGRFAGYSNPGASVLLGAPGGEVGYKRLVSTDRVGRMGYNQIDYFGDPELNNYVFYGSGFTGTSGAAPLVSGAIALMLEVNPSLSYRDVQQILIHSSRHAALADPDLATNGAGFMVSHNLGFGLLDAGRAVELAQAWPPQPEPVSVHHTVNEVKAIRDAGARLIITDATGTEVGSFAALPNQGKYPDAPTGRFPLVYVGTNSAPLTTSLDGKAGLALRDANSTQLLKLQRIAEAGAEFGIIMNNDAGQPHLLGRIGGTDFLPIPTVFISKASGDQLLGILSDTTKAFSGRIELFSTEHTINVPETLITHHVGLRVKTDHMRRGDLRITLVSPSGARSVMQNLSADDQPGPIDWTYHSTHHFYEPSAGMWRVYVTDLLSNNIGSVLSVALEVQGTPILDLDRDGLADTWEIRHFLNLAQDAHSDSDNDGYNNAREQVVGSDPTRDETPYQLRVDRWNDQFVRLSWPSVTGAQYEILRTPSLRAGFQPYTNAIGRWPENALVLPAQESQAYFYQIQARPAD